MPYILCALNYSFVTFNFIWDFLLVSTELNKQNIYIYTHFLFHQNATQQLTPRRRDYSHDRRLRIHLLYRHGKQFTDGILPLKGPDSKLFLLPRKK